jgi:hypothetical protein
VSPPLASWPEVLATALVGTSRTGVPAEPLVDAAAAHALRRRAGAGPVRGLRLPEPAPSDPAPQLAPAAAARADALLALGRPAREVTPVRDVAARLELLTEWLGAAAATGRRLPPELLPALLEAARRHRQLRPAVPAVGGPRAAWLAAQRPEWAFACARGSAGTGPASGATGPGSPGAVADPGDSTVGDDTDWELGSIDRRVAYLRRLRRRDPTRGRRLLAAVWEAEPPDDRAALLGACATGLSGDDEPLLEQALDDRRRQVRATAVELLGRLPDSGHARRMAARALACVDLNDPAQLSIAPPAACDRSMIRDGISARPPAGVGERAWWLEEIVARTPLRVWPEPAAVLGRRGSEDWAGGLRRGLARAAAGQGDPTWAAALLDPLTAEALASGHPGDRLLLEALYDALRPEDVAARAVAVLRRGLAHAAAAGGEHVLGLCPSPWPQAVAEEVLAALAHEAGQRGTGWRMAGLCELAALRVPAGFAARARELLERVRAATPQSPAVRVLERFAATVQFRRDMLEELA